MSSLNDCVSHGWPERPSGPAVAGRVAELRWSALRWPETLQLLKQLSKAVGALPNTFASLIFDRLTCAPRVSLLLEVSWCRTTDSCRRVVYFQTGCEEHILVTTIPAGSEPKSPRPQSYMRRQQHDSSKESQGFTPLFIFAHPHFKIVPCPPRICATRN